MPILLPKPPPGAAVTPATAIAGLACFVAFRFCGFHGLRVVLRAVDFCDEAGFAAK